MNGKKSKQIVYWYDAYNDWNKSHKQGYCQYHIAKVYIESDKWAPIGHIDPMILFFEIFAKKETNLQKWIQIHTNGILRTCNYNFNKTSYSKLIEIIHLFRGILLWVKKYYCKSFDE